jgi:hypothetical protein
VRLDNTIPTPGVATILRVSPSISGWDGNHISLKCSTIKQVRLWSILYVYVQIKQMFS